MEVHDHDVFRCQGLDNRAPEIIELAVLCSESDDPILQGRLSHRRHGTSQVKGIAIAAVLDSELVLLSAVALQEILQSLLCDHLSSVDHHYPVTRALHIGENVSGEENCALVSHAGNQLQCLKPPLWVQS